MINNIVELLKYANFNDKQNIKLAKGGNKLPENWSEFKKAIKHIKEK